MTGNVQGLKGAAKTTDTYLLCEVFLIKVGLGEKFDSIFTAILCWRAHIYGLVNLQATTRIHMVILGRRGAGKDLANVVDDGITPCTEFANDLEFPSGILVVYYGRVVGDEAKDFTLEVKSLANEVSGGENIVCVRGGCRAGCGGGRTGGPGDRLGEASCGKSWRGKRGGYGCGKG